jgi:hypothetical protein
MLIILSTVLIIFFTLNALSSLYMRVVILI